ncbi:transcription factor E2F-4 dP-2/DNA ternarY [Caudoviricetes sp.]|nr:transcription factor E2F-4 dP-2/DNA ternarY [Caudoviricetes sp.]
MSTNASAAIQVIKAIADSIKELGEVPSGHLYAMVAGHMDLTTYDKIINILIASNLIKREDSHLLVWVGP